MATETALECAMNELARVTELWRQSEVNSRDFQQCLYGLCRRIKRGQPLDQAVVDAEDLLKRKHTMSILREADLEQVP